MSAPALEMRGVRLAYPGREVLRGVDLVVEPGEHVLLVGPSGSGKSTILKIAAGLVAPLSGDVLLGGRPASDAGRVRIPPERRGVGYLFQGGALWPHMGARRTLHFVLAAAGVPRRERASRVDELLDLVGLRGVGDRRPATLSGGEAQRLALARAIAARPPLLLLDEPLGPLDAELRGALLARLGELQRSLGFAALHVTHDAAESAALATRLVALRDGRLTPGSIPPAATLVS